MNAEITYVGPLHGLHLDAADPFVVLACLLQARFEAREPQRVWSLSVPQSPTWEPIDDRFAVLLGAHPLGPNHHLGPKGAALVFDRGVYVGFFELGRHLMPADKLEPFREALAATARREVTR